VGEGEAALEDVQAQLVELLLVRREDVESGVQDAQGVVVAADVRETGGELLESGEALGRCVLRVEAVVELESGVVVRAPEVATDEVEPDGRLREVGLLEVGLQVGDDLLALRDRVLEALDRDAVDVRDEEAVLVEDLEEGETRLVSPEPRKEVVVDTEAQVERDEARLRERLEVLVTECAAFDEAGPSSVARSRDVEEDELRLGLRLREGRVVVLLEVEDLEPVLGLVLREGRAREDDRERGCEDRGRSTRGVRQEAALGIRERTGSCS